MGRNNYHTKMHRILSYIFFYLNNEQGNKAIDAFRCFILLFPDVIILNCYILLSKNERFNRKSGFYEENISMHKYSLKKQIIKAI